MTTLAVTKNSTARGLRTTYQSIVGLLAAVPVILVIFALIPADTPFYQQMSVVVTNVVLWAGIASKALNILEERGLIPAPWKTVTEVPATTVDAITETSTNDPFVPEQLEVALETDPEAVLAGQPIEDITASTGVENTVDNPGGEHRADVPTDHEEYRG